MRGSDDRRPDERVASVLAPTLMGVGPRGAWLVMRLVDDYAKRKHYAALPADARELRDAAADVVRHAQRGPADVRRSPDPAPWPQDEITTKEAAVLTGYTDKHVRRLAEEGRAVSARKVRGRWLVSRASIEAYADERQQSA